MARMLALVAIVVLLATSSVGTGAQDATPAAYPLTPDPAGCRIEPRSIESVIAVVGIPTAEEPAAPANPTPFVRPQGEPADATATEAVIASVHELFACANAGDFRRIFALVTDEYLRVFLAGTPMNDQVVALFTASPVALPPAELRIIVRIEDVQILPDGRAGVVVVRDEPADPRTVEPDYVFLERVGDRGLFDAVVEDGGMAGTPSPGTLARDAGSAVGGLADVVGRHPAGEASHLNQDPLQPIRLDRAAERGHLGELLDRDDDGAGQARLFP